MQRGGARQLLGVSSIIAALSLSCAGSAGPRAPAAPHPLQAGPRSLDQSPICSSLGDRFIGLPAVGDPGAAATAAIVGSWWVRGCSVQRSDDRLDIRLRGPGWYWVGETSSGLAVEQQVPFELSVQLEGRVRDGSAAGLLSLWFEPASKPRVRVVAPERLKVRSTNALGVLLQLVPLASPEGRAARRFSERMTAALEQRLGEGATVTYDFGSGQADATLGRLAKGSLPRHPFQGSQAWVVNDRFLLPPAGTQVIGPVSRGASRLDVAVESGPGMDYRALCSENMSEHYGSIAAGRLSSVPDGLWTATGTLRGPGQHSVDLRVSDCKFYVVLSTAGASSTLVALRVR